MNIFDEVQHKIDYDRAQAQQIAARLLKSPRADSGVQDNDIRLFFPELYGANNVQITNLPTGTALRHYLLFGQPFVLDLLPVTAGEFLHAHNISLSFAQEMAERKLIIPNLYIRNAEKWRGNEDMAGLVRLSYVNGERIDRYMSERGAYESFVTAHEPEIKRALERAAPETKTAIIEAARTDDLESLPIREARRWAYLDILNPTASTEAAQFLECGQLPQFMSFLRISKHKFASHITAALGGTYVFGPYDFAIIEREGVQLTPLMHHLKFTEAMEYLLAEIADVEPFEKMDAVEEHHLRAFLTRQENIDIRDQIPARLDDLVTWALEEKLDTNKVREFKAMVEDYRNRLKRSKLILGMVGAATLGAFGSVVGPIGGTIGGLIGFFAGRSDPLTDFLISKGPTQRRHRAFLYLNNVRKRRAS